MNTDPISARYRINAALLPLNWTPEPWQVIYFPNPNRWNSIWLGTVWNFMLFPTRVNKEFLQVLFSAQWIYAFPLLGAMFVGCFKWLAMGFSGKLRAVKLPAKIRMQAEFFTAEEAALAIRAGDTRGVIDLVEEANKAQ